MSVSPEARAEFVALLEQYGRLQDLLVETPVVPDYYRY